MSAEEMKTQTWEKLNCKKSALAAFIILLVPLVIMFAGYILENVRPLGVDSVASMASTHLYRQWENESGEKALWNPNTFSGMPTYHRISPKIFHPDVLLSFLGSISYLYFWYFLLGGFGMYALLYSRKIPWYAAVIVAVGFVLLPHWQALISVGHYSKLRAFMVMPWLILSFQFLFEKKKWYTVGLFSLMFSWMVRTQHVQVVFYGILILLFLYLVPVIKLLIHKNFREFGNLTLKISVAVVLTVIVSAQPFLSLNEYTQHSTRGGNPLQLGTEQESASKARGVGLDYATRWSLSPKEILNFFFPRFFGGMSSETYQGEQYPQLKGRTIPGYWGDMPFTQSYDSMGFLLFLFALIGVIRFYKLGQVKSLALFTVFTVLLGFGHHFISFYKVFYYTIPYFSKFRVPVMIVNMTFFTLLMLAGYGFKAIFENSNHKKDDYTELAIFGGGLVFILLLLLFRNQYSYMAAGEGARYPAGTAEILRGIRKEFLTKDLLRAFWVTVIAGGAIAAYHFRKLAKLPALLVILAMIGLELGIITKTAHDQIPLGNEKVMERRQFAETEITRFLKAQPDEYRGLVLGKGFQDNHYAYWYPMINGYSAIKLQIIQDAVDHLLFAGSDETGVNWTVVNMLNGRYIIAPGMIDAPFLEARVTDRSRGDVLFENKNALPKAWFIREFKNVSRWEESVPIMNSPDFDPAVTALIMGKEGNYTGEGVIRLKEKNPNTLIFDVEIDENQFAVISEMYYPDGWTVLFNNEKLPVYQVNYLLRGVEIPAGTGELIMQFSPKSYHWGVFLSWVGCVIVWILIGAGLWLEWKKSKADTEIHA
jgi:hypothetical protein